METIHTLMKMIFIKMLKRIVKQVYKNYGVNFLALIKTFKYNLLDAVKHNNSIIVAHPKSLLRIDKEGKIILNAPLYFGKQIFKRENEGARILIYRGG